MVSSTGTSSLFTMSAASLTVSTSKNPTTSFFSILSQTISLPEHVTVTGHGLDTSLELAVARSSIITWVYATGYWGSIDANTLWLPNGPSGAPNLVATYGLTPPVTTTTSSTYVGGWRFTRQRLTETFYLPGFTAGITLPTDIVPPADLQNPESFLDALLTPLTGYQNYENDGPAPWLDFPIYVVRTTALKFEDLT